MTYIRIKVKHLLMVILALAAVFAVVVFLQGNILYMMGKLSELGGNDGRAAVYYDRAAEEFPSSNTSIISAQRKLELLFDKKNFIYFNKLKLAGNSTILEGSFISADSADRVNLQYESIAKNGAKDDKFAEYSIYVAMVNYFAGYGENAVKILKKLDYVMDSDIKKIGTLNLAAVQMGLGNMDAGYEALKDSLGEKDKYSLIRQEFYAYYCFMKGDFEGFAKADVKPTEWYEATKSLDDLLLMPLLRIGNTISGYKDIIEKTEELNQNNNVFIGKVSIDGKPAAYAMVYLKDTNYRNVDSSNMGMSDGIRCVAVTDGEGSFRIENVPNGIYGVGVCIDWQRVQGRALQVDKSYSLQFTGSTGIERDISFLDTSEMLKVEDVGEGKLRFIVKMPEETKYYTIGMGELVEVENNQIMANNRFVSENIDTAEYVLDTAKERYRGMNTGASFGTDGIDPRYLFEPFYHTGDYVYYVTFYDTGGHILYDSNGIYPSRQAGYVHISGSQWSEADELLLDKRYGEAIKLYETQLNDGQQGLHALKVLTKLYYNGWEFDDETSTLKYKDKRKATEYFEKLADSIKDNEQINSSLAWLYIDEGRYQEGLELLQLKKSSYGLREIARVYGYMGEFSKAEEYYKSFYSETGHGADMLLMLYILQDKKELLPETASNYIDNGSFYASYVTAIQEYLKMDTTQYGEFFRLIARGQPDDAAVQIEGRKDDLAQLYKGLLLLQKRIPDYREREKQYKSFYDAVKDPSIRQLLKNFGKAGIQSGFGEE